MSNFHITYSGLSHPKHASVRPYGRRHLSDFLDVWPHYGAAFGIDHLIYADGTVELRVQGDRLPALLADR